MLLLVLGKNAKTMKEGLNMWILTAIRLATSLYDDTEKLQPLYSTYDFILHFAPVGEREGSKRVGSAEGCKISGSDGSLKQILQTVKETVIRLAFVWIVCSR